MDQLLRGTHLQRHDALEESKAMNRIDLESDLIETMKQLVSSIVRVDRGTSIRVLVGAYEHSACESIEVCPHGKLIDSHDDTGTPTTATSGTSRSWPVPPAQLSEAPSQHTSQHTSASGDEVVVRLADERAVVLTPDSSFTWVILSARGGGGRVTRCASGVSRRTGPVGSGSWTGVARFCGVGRGRGRERCASSSSSTPPYLFRFTMLKPCTT